MIAIVCGRHVGVEDIAVDSFSDDDDAHNSTPLDLVNPSITLHLHPLSPLHHIHTSTRDTYTHTPTTPTPSNHHPHNHNPHTHPTNNNHTPTTPITTLRVEEVKGHRGDGSMAGRG